MKITKFKEDFFLWSMGLVFITLPMPKYSLSSQALILFIIAWLGINSFSEKIVLFKKNIKNILLLSTIFFVMLVGMLYTKDFLEGLGQLKDKLPFLLFPILLATSPSFLFNKKYNFIKLFSVSVVLMAIFSLLKSLYIFFSGMGDYFIYEKLSIVLNKHTTYYSLYCVIAISYFLYDLLYLKKTSKTFSIVCIIFLLLFIYLLSVRIAIIALMLITVYYVKTTITQKKEKFFLSILIVASLLSTLLFSSNYVSRFESIHNNPEKLAENNEFNTRLIHWKSALETLSGIDYMIGKGTGDGKENLYKQYLKNDFKAGYQRKYNAHNQYIEFLMANGLIAILAYICLLLMTLVYSIRINDIFGILVVLLFTIYSLTESILERQSGIFIVALLCNLLFFSNKKLLNKSNEKY
ncbi:O-antigen ligase family protein [Mesonia aestuariivivens]|uniref:O-antigen ligase family protein n=1 Tax=Mesonia aestuariivivens TaxID=2796128 RepID=A0ABS6W0Y3_9FLAO|nr:O-antigen ligase family protein [Mesonia aestuariivivens]MBW2961520.1 O-antigen ligase family protein [Mesonia aestuariivivens]